MLSLIEMIFTKEAVEASASCTRSMTPDDLQTCVNYALYFGKAQCDPMYYIPSAGKVRHTVGFTSAGLPSALLGMLIFNYL